MRRRRFSSQKMRRFRAIGLTDLNLTSLTDMFAFLLCVLLKQFTVSSVDIKPVAGMDLPTSHSRELPQRYVAIDIDTKGIYLERQLIQPLQNFELPGTNAQSDTLFVLRTLIKEKIERGEIESTTAVIRADRAAPFDIIWKVMYTARQVGFEEFQNLTVQESEKKRT